MIKRAIIHVENTENLLDFAEYLSTSGWTILTANKTEEILKSAKIPVIREQALVENNLYINDTSQLIRRILMTKYEQNDAFISPDHEENNIFLVCINVVPEMNTTLASRSTTQIRPLNYYVTTVLRNSFTNYPNVLLLTDPADYKEAMIQLKTDNITNEFRTYLAAKALNLISAYDAGLSASILQNQQYDVQFMNYLMYPFKKTLQLHTGSNSQQSGFLYKSPTQSGALNGFLKLQGKDFNYNTISDVSFAWERICTLYNILKNQYTVKSTNCDGYDFTTQFTPLTGTVFTIAIKFEAIIGASLSTNVVDSFKNTYTYDTENITDAVLACSAVIDAPAAQEIIKGSFSAVVAPSFTSDAKQILSLNKNIRLIPSAKVSNISLSGKMIHGGILLQTRDSELFEHWHVRTKNRPSQFKTDEMAFGMLLVMGARSYSSVLLKNNAIAGVAQGCSSVNRSLNVVYETAISQLEHKKQETNGEQASELDNSLGDVLISDSTIPFEEPIKKLIDAGITAIIQTGGTPADNEFINYCDERGIVMVFTGMTHISF
jgi:phosphoribosylaminoimidazolecarboxamide formyltransferase/IMP cyclohydrolase